MEIDESVAADREETTGAAKITVCPVIMNKIHLTGSVILIIVSVVINILLIIVTVVINILLIMSHKSPYYYIITS